MEQPQQGSSSSSGAGPAAGGAGGGGASAPGKFRVLDPVLGGRRALIAVASPGEAEAVLVGMGVKGEAAKAHSGRAWELHHVAGRFDVIITGIGKANAAGAVGRGLDLRSHACVLSVGVAGSLPGSEAQLGQAVVADRSVSADDGLATPAGFLTCAKMGFPLGPFPESGVPADGGLLDALRPLCDLAAPIATVSTCSGTDAHARAIAAVTGASLEAMEGAAIGQVCARVGVPFAELRVVSNTTGDRPKQVWVLREALVKLSQVVRCL